jgi:REP element-mobilizing transposase RayT
MQLVESEPAKNDGPRPSPFLGRHHARFHDPDVVYHVIARTFQGAMLLTPGPELNRLIAGVIARAQELCADVRLYAYAFMSNHVHLMLQGPPAQVPAFIGFVKGEISRRWGPQIRWRDGLWGPTYLSTALPSDEDQLNCLEYVLSQGVKEGLVDRPESWPGVHAAKQLMTQKPLVGDWLDGTAYSKARFKDLARIGPRRVQASEFVVTKEVRVDPLPAWAQLDSDSRSRELARMRSRIIERGVRTRAGKRVAGTARVMATQRTKRRELPKPPWWENRRRFVCWSARTNPAAIAYLHAYWAFQWAFREASLRYVAGDHSVEFPPGAFRPGRIAA